MVRSGNSNVSMRSDSTPAIASNRHSQVMMTRRRSVQDGEALAEQTNLDEEFLLIEFESEPARQQTTANAWFDCVLEVPRVGALLPTSLETMSNVPADAVPGEPRERELADLRTQRRLLLVLLGSLVGASAALYVGSVHPETLRQQHSITHLYNALSEQQAQHQRQWNGLTSRLSILDTRLSEMDSKLNAMHPASVPSSMVTDRASSHVLPSEGNAKIASSNLSKALMAISASQMKSPNTEDSKPTESRAAADSAQSTDAPSTASAAPLPVVSPSASASSAPVQTESTARPSLRDAMREVAVRDSKRPPLQHVPNRHENAEPLNLAAKCDRADPLCGDLD